jgi:glucosyl-dolichyl phosphate glucuronosyltransferase
VSGARIRPGHLDAPRVSVVICVYTEQRWDDMLAAVESVLGQSRPAHELIVVVDHNPALVRRLTDVLAGPGGLPESWRPAEYRLQPQYQRPSVKITPNRQAQGLSGGKNTGVAAASGDIVAFLDDDAVAEPDWLKFFADTYRTTTVAGVGGMTLPLWDTRRPAWFPREFDWVVGCNYAGQPGSQQPVRNLLGGNASFRREVFDLAGGFPAGVGRSAGRLPLGGEETEFCIRLRQLRPETTLLIDDRAVIWHRVPASRCRFSYFMTRCYAEGLSKAQVSRTVGTSAGLSAERRHVLETLPAAVARNLAAPLRGDLAGPRRAGAILAGLAAASAGYAAGRTGRRHD